VSAGGRPPDADAGPLTGGLVTAIARAGRLAARRPVLVITDFDGTLSPIVNEPSAASIVPEARDALLRLGATFAATSETGGDVVIAVLSGRDAADVARRVAVPGLRYLGQHGIETADLAAAASEPVTAIDPALVRAGGEVEQLADRLAALLGRPAWLGIEPKGASVGLHYRNARDPDTARASIHAALDDLAIKSGAPEFERMDSRRVVELRPARAQGKGEATRRLIDEVRPRAILALGDDRTDAAGFRVIRSLRDRGAVAALVVGISGAAETPPEVRDAVDLLVASPAEAAAILAALADALDAGRRGAAGGASRPADA
jgi:trehalose 6-phosphate phosphatase